jgi:hypothetical protein
MQPIWQTSWNNQPVGYTIDPGKTDALRSSESWVQNTNIDLKQSPRRKKQVQLPKNRDESYYRHLWSQVLGVINQLT